MIQQIEIKLEDLSNIYTWNCIPAIIVRRSFKLRLPPRSELRNYPATSAQTMMYDMSGRPNWRELRRLTDRILRILFIVTFPLSEHGRARHVAFDECCEWLCFNVLAHTLRAFVTKLIRHSAYE